MISGSLKLRAALHGAERGLWADLHGDEFKQHCPELQISDTQVRTTRLHLIRF